VRADGRIGGVRVLAHAETPGLGDPIPQDRGPWIDDFAGSRLGDPPAARWDVRKHGGDFDQFAGATISPRAVVRAVARALALLERHEGRLADAPGGATLRFDDGPESPP
jgi:electron transport complex protein RnfG